MLYGDLRAMAARFLRLERRGHTLQSTALVHELYLRLRQQHRPGWENRDQFRITVSSQIRRILVDHARLRLAGKRGSGAAPVPLDSIGERLGPAAVEFVALDDALRDLERFDPVKARLVELRFFAGLSMEEVAESLGVSVRTAHREWTVARAWLQAYMDGHG